MNVAYTALPKERKEKQGVVDTPPAYHCLKQRRETESGAAALCTIAQHYDLKVTPAGLSRLTGLDDVSDETLARN